jgi:hypothetical protein
MVKSFIMHMKDALLFNDALATENFLFILIMINLLAPEFHV